MSTSSCQHPTFYQLPDDFACEICHDLFSPCKDDETVPKTPEHEKACKACSNSRKKLKFSVVAEDWQEKLSEYNSEPLVKRKKRAKA